MAIHLHNTWVLDQQAALDRAFARRAKAIEDVFLAPEAIRRAVVKRDAALRVLREQYDAALDKLALYGEAEAARRLVRAFVEPEK